MLVAGLVVATVAFSLLFFALRNRPARIIFLDVGQGDATLLQTPLGKNILIDAGAHNDIDKKIARYMDRNDRHIDMLILTHPDLDHVAGGLTLVDRYSIGLVGHSGLLAGSEVYEFLASKIAQQNIPTQRLQAGQTIFIEPGLSIDVLSPESNIKNSNANEHSTVLQISYKESSVLITADAGKLTEHTLVDVYGESLKSEILKVGHHGSHTSTSNIFIELVDPDFGIISAACNSRFGHPHPEVLSTLFSWQVDILDTCNHGDIVFTFQDGLWYLDQLEPN